MIHTKRTGSTRLITGINITPFTDICLVLLIIFMVTASALTKETTLRLNLPRAETAKAPMPTSVTVKITSDLEMFLNNERIDVAALGSRLEQIHQEQGTRMLVVKADEGIPYKMVISTIDTARKVGFDQIALATRDPQASLP